MRGLPCVAIVGTNGFLRAGLGHILKAAHVRVIASARDFIEISDDISTHKSLLLVVDAGDDAEAAATQIKRFKKRQPHARVAVIAEECPLKGLVAVFLAGANVCFQTDIGAKAFITALELVMMGETILPPALLDLKCLLSMEAPSPTIVGPTLATEEESLQKWEPRGLSTREWQILQHVAAGEANKVIARKVDIAEATVKVHVKTILRKIGVNNRTQAAIWVVNSLSTSERKSDASGSPELSPLEAADIGRDPPSH